MDVRYVNPFIGSVKTVFKTMVHTDVIVGKPTVATTRGEPTADVSAVIGLSGDAVGCVVLCLPMTTAVNATSKFAGTEMSKDHPDFADALGELANMVAGKAKAELDGLKVSISLPSVIVGSDHVVSQSRQQPKLVLPCDSVLGKFWVEVALVVAKAKTVTPVAETVGSGI